jgi:hypothetical protein
MMAETSVPLFEIAPSVYRDGPVYEAARDVLNSQTPTFTFLPRNAMSPHCKQLLDDVCTVLGDPTTISTAALMAATHKKGPWRLFSDHMETHPRMSNKLMVQWFSSPQGQERIRGIVFESVFAFRGVQLQPPGCCIPPSAN